VNGTYELRLREDEEFTLDLEAALPTVGYQVALGFGRFHYDPAEHPQKWQLARGGRQQIMSRDTLLWSYGQVPAGARIPVLVRYGEQRASWASKFWLTLIVLSPIVAVGLGVALRAGRTRRAGGGETLLAEFAALDARLARGEIDEREFAQLQADLAGRAGTGRLSPEARRALETFVDKYRDPSSAKAFELAQDLARLDRLVSSGLGKPTRGDVD